MRAAAISVLVLGAALAVLMLAAAIAAPVAPSSPAPTSTRVLVTWRGYEGDMETAGDVLAWRYAAPLMRLEYTDLDRDGIRRMGFEAPPAAPCIGGAP